MKDDQDSIEKTKIYKSWQRRENRCHQIAEDRIDPLGEKSMSFDEYMARELVSCGVPRELAKITWDDVEPRPKLSGFDDACGQLNSRWTPSRGAILLGDPGTGKSMLASLCCRSILLAGGGLKFSTAERILASLKPGDEVSQNEERVREVGILVIDDLGAEYSTEWTRATLDGIISSRHAGESGIIMTSNHYKNELAKVLAPRLIDRLFETCEVYEFKGESYRVKA